MKKTKPLNLIEFIKIKYWNIFVDIKKANKEFKENQENLRKYWTLKSAWKYSEASFLARNLITAKTKQKESPLN